MSIDLEGVMERFFLWVRKLGWGRGGDLFEVFRLRSYRVRVGRFLCLNFFRIRVLIVTGRGVGLFKGVVVDVFRVF